MSLRPCATISVSFGEPASRAASGKVQPRSGTANALFLRLLISQRANSACVLFAETRCSSLAPIFKRPRLYNRGNSPFGARAERCFAEGFPLAGNGKTCWPQQIVLVRRAVKYRRDLRLPKGNLRKVSSATPPRAVTARAYICPRSPHNAQTAHMCCLQKCVVRLSAQGNPA